MVSRTLAKAPAVNAVAEASTTKRREEERKRDMFEFTESIHIEAPPDVVWQVLEDIEGWWPSSNPEHQSIERLDSHGIQVGARLRIREKVAGIPGEAIGTITALSPGKEVTWTSDRAKYRWLGQTLILSEGVTWRIEPTGPSATTLSAHVWARFPETLRGRASGWIFVHVLDGVAKDRLHARTELEYLKNSIEAG